MLYRMDAAARSQTFPAVWDAISARAAAIAGADTLFLSGSALAASLGFPDVGLIRVEELLHAAQRIVQATKLPLVVYVETGYGGLPALVSLVRDLKMTGVAGILMLSAVEFGHEPGRSCRSSW